MDTKPSVEELSVEERREQEEAVEGGRIDLLARWLDERARCSRAALRTLHDDGRPSGYEWEAALLQVEAERFEEIAGLLRGITDGMSDSRLTLEV